MNAAQAMSRPVAISTIGTAKSIKRIEATADERVGLAAALGLVDVLALSAEFDLHRDTKGTIHLDGRIDADVVQNCVISLEPVRQRISEPIQLRLIGAGEDDQSPKSSGTAAVEIDPTGEDPPEVIVGPTIDLGGLIVEYLFVAIDPYPRAPGAVLPDNPVESAADSPDSPFAGLAEALRRHPRKR